MSRPRKDGSGLGVTLRHLLSHRATRSFVIVKATAQCIREDLVHLMRGVGGYKQYCLCQLWQGYSAHLHRQLLRRLGKGSDKPGVSALIVRLSCVSRWPAALGEQS